MSHTVHIH